MPGASFVLAGVDLILADDLTHKALFRRMLTEAIDILESDEARETAVALLKEFVPSGGDN